MRNLFKRLRRTARRFPWRTGFLVVALVFAGWVAYLDHIVRQQFEGKRWALPARVYAQAQELYPGARLADDRFAALLAQLGYRPGPNAEEPGTYDRGADHFDVYTRAFTFGDGLQPPTRFRVSFLGGKVASLQDLEQQQLLPLVRIEPLLIGSLYPAHQEDRLLVKLAETPPSLVPALIAMEDRKFYGHIGIDPRGIARALIANVRGKPVQGGSTLTQQLVKNFYLTSDRTLRRKFTEMIMAVLLEIHYDKDEILEAYVNEIYLGQEGRRSIHGFGLASQFYFDRALGDLDLAQTALLVALVKGPSYYDPRKHPARARARRDLVLAELARQGVISDAQYTDAKAAPLGVTPQAPSGASPYPAFLDLVQRQLRAEYRDEDLRSEGLQIFTTLDVATQTSAETALRERLKTLERTRGLPDNGLEGAVVITNTDNGEILALVGGRNARFAGFNRALDAQRQIGSLIKPVVYLAALTHPDRYTLGTLIDDSELVIKDAGREWRPLNYDKAYHGRVTLQKALAESYNLPVVRVGLDIGVANVVATAKRLGVERRMPAYGATLLGAVGLTPIEVAQMYQTLASGGFRMPLRAIREILTRDGQPLQRYAISIEPAVDPAPVYLVTAAMQAVVREGTGQGLSHYLAPELGIAGKTGTTDDLRDAWFAGYSGDRLGIVWVGRDDNRPARLTGASGALTVWGDMMARLDPEPLKPKVPEGIERVWIDPENGLLADASCANAVELPFIKGSAPTETATCARRSPAKAIKNWFRRLFER